MRMRLVAAIPVIALLVAGEGCAKKAAPKLPPPKVQVITVTPRDVPIYQEWIGTLDGYPNARIRAQVSGYLLRQDYTEGSNVKKGDLLFEIDPRPFQAVVDQARARLAQDQALQGRTELDVRRYTPLARTQAISQEQLDDAIQANLQAMAAVKADQAAIETAQLNLGFTRITSPIDGIADVATAQLGDLVGPGGQVLTTVSTVDPIRAYFNIDEDFYLSFARKNAASDLPESRPADIQLQLILADGSTYPQPGEWYFTGSQVNINTGTLQVAARFRNHDSILRPGEYARIRARTSVHKGALVVPQRAVTELQGTYQVALVDGQNKIHIQTVQVGTQTGTDWVINDGLHANDKVVAEGTQKVRDGSEVDPQPYVPNSAGATNSPTSGGKG